MAVTAQTGVFSFGGQTGKTTISSTFFKHRASDIDLATISDDRLGPPEVGGEPVRLSVTAFPPPGSLRSLLSQWSCCRRDKDEDLSTLLMYLNSSG